MENHRVRRSRDANENTVKAQSINGAMITSAGRDRSGCRPSEAREAPFYRHTRDHQCGTLDVSPRDLSLLRFELVSGTLTAIELSIVPLDIIRKSHTFDQFFVRYGPPGFHLKR